jgi:hypothetical protein
VTDDWVGGCNVPQYDERYHGKGYSKMPERFPDKETAGNGWPKTNAPVVTKTLGKTL